MDELQRLRFVTERYPHLQGLRLLPIAAPFLAAGAWRDGHLRWLPGSTGHGSGYWFLGAVVLALAASSALGVYYRRRFGWVQPRRNVGPILLFLGFASALAVSFRMQAAFEWTFSAPAIVIGLALAWVGLAEGQVRSHYLALAGACLLFATLGTWNVSTHARDVLLDYLIGLGLIAIGLGDHLLLRGTLEPCYSHARTV